MNKYRVRVTHEDRGSYAKYFGSLSEADAHAPPPEDQRGV